MKSLLLAVTASVCTFSCAASSGLRQPSNSPPTSVTVIATADFHGELDSQEGVTADGLSLTIGGASYLATYLKILRLQTDGPVLWVDAGDLFQGSMASNLFEGAPVVRLMNHLGLDAAALGNHEFDYGPAGEKAVPRAASDDPRGALKARIAEARFPILAANVKSIEGQLPDWLKSSAVIVKNGIRIGVVGGASPGTPGTTNALNLGGLVFHSLMPSLQMEARRLRQEEKVDLVVLAVHEGGSCDDNSPGAQDDLSSCQPSPVFELAKQLPRGLVNMIIAGHSHKGMAKRVNGIAIIQPFSHGKYIGWATLPLGENGQPEVEGMVPVCRQVVNTAGGKTCDPILARQARGPLEAALFFGQEIEPDKKTAALLAPDLSKVKALKESSLGINALDPISRNLKGESAMGNLMADAARDALPGIDLGLVNAGGLRANINAGPVTYGDIFNVLPFDNQAAVMRISGRKLTELVRTGLFAKVGVFSWSSNLSIATANCELKELKVNGRAVDEQKIYSIATSDFLASGGNGVALVQIPKDNVEFLWDRKNILRELTAEVLKKWKRNIRSVDFFNPESPRQKIAGTCNGG